MTPHDALTAITLALAAALAQAHGTDPGAHKPAFDASKVEPTAFGQEGDPRRVARTIRVDMADTMRFTPAHITLRRGQTVRFVVHNAGQLLHEMVLGTPEALRAHAELMKKFPDMEHADPNMVHVKPGARGEMVWQFTRPGTFQFACLLPGHFEAGMIGTLVVK